MISVSDFRNGVTFDMDGKVMQIIEFQHVKPGKGAAFVRVKMRNVSTGGVTETTFNPNDKYPTAYIERRKMDYSYNDEIGNRILCNRQIVRAEQLVQRHQFDFLPFDELDSVFGHIDFVR